MILLILCLYVAFQAAIVAAYRTGGIGTALLDAAISWLRSKGIKDIYLESGQNNHSAHEYFIRRGFRKVSEIYKLA